MRKNVPNEPNMEAILDLLTALDGGLLKAVQENGISIVVTIAPAEPDEDDWDEDDDDYDDMEDDDDEDCCPGYEPAGDDGRCVYCCPECGACLRE